MPQLSDPSSDTPCGADPAALNLPVDLPDVQTELQACFTRYEAALRGNDVAQLDAFFWPDERVVRYGVADLQHGHAQLAHWRRHEAPAVGPLRRTERTAITTFGRDVGVAMTEFRNTPGGPVGRQSQTWVRGPHGWRIVAAHVSLPAGGASTTSAASAASAASASTAAAAQEPVVPAPLSRTGPGGHA